MKEFTLTFSTANAAFEDGPQAFAHDLLTIVNEIAATIEDSGSLQASGIVYDVNGNRVGQWAYELPTPQED